MSLSRECRAKQLKRQQQVLRLLPVAAVSKVLPFLDYTGPLFAHFAVADLGHAL